MIGVVGTRLTGVADALAERMGLGETLVGAVLLGASTSLSGIVTSVTVAAGSSAELAVSNAVGGIAAQTFVLAVADAFYPRANLEYAAASPTNLAQGALLITLLAILLVAFAGPEISFWGVHPATPLLLGAYLLGLRMISKAQTQPIWQATRTSETQIEEEQEESEHGDFDDVGTRLLWVRFALYAPLIGAAGWVVARAGVNIAEQTGLTVTPVGGVFNAVVTSLPELVTSVAAVRRGAVSLAVGGIIGGNAFDTIVVAFSDVAHREGSIYHAISEHQVYLISLTVLLTGLLLLGLLRREKYGVANIDFDSLLIMILYLTSFTFLAFD